MHVTRYKILWPWQCFFIFHKNVGRSRSMYEGGFDRDKYCIPLLIGFLRYHTWGWFASNLIEDEKKGKVYWK